MKRGLSQDASAQGTSRRLTLLSSIDVPLVAAAAAMPVVLLAANLPSNLLLPAIAFLAFAFAAAGAIAGWVTRTPRNPASATVWDFAGACVLFGIAAGVFSESVQISQLLGIATTAP